MKRIITACVLFLLMVFGCAMEYRTVSQTANALSASVSGQTEPEILSASLCRMAKQKKLASAMIAHNEIDQIETLYLRAMQAAENQNIYETRLQVAELTGMLLHLSQIQFRICIMYFESPLLYCKKSNAFCHNKYPPAKPGVFHMRAKPSDPRGHVKRVIRSASRAGTVTCYP